MVRAVAEDGWKRLSRKACRRSRVGGDCQSVRREVSRFGGGEHDLSHIAQIVSNSGSRHSVAAGIIISDGSVERFPFLLVVDSGNA